MRKFFRQIIGVIVALLILIIGMPVYAENAEPGSDGRTPAQGVYGWEHLSQDSDSGESDEDDAPVPDLLAVPLTLWGIYAIGHQDNGEKVLGTFWLMGATMSHGTEPAQTGLFLLSLYNFTHLTGGDVSNKEVAEHNLVGFLLIGLSEMLYNAYDKPAPETEKGLSYGMYLDPQMQSPILRFEYRF